MIQKNIVGYMRDMLTRFYDNLMTTLGFFYLLLNIMKLECV